MKKYRMLTTGAHDKLAATDFRAFGPFTDPDDAKHTLWVCEGVEDRDYTAEELAPVSADAEGNWTTSIEGLVWVPYVRGG